MFRREFPSASPFRTPRSVSLIQGPQLAKGVMGPVGESLMVELLDNDEEASESATTSAELDPIFLNSSERQDDVLRRDASIEGETVENYRLLQEARDVLGEQNVHGVKDVEFALDYSIDRSKVPPIPYTKADFLKSKEIKEKTGVEEMLILCVADRDGAPLTMKMMEEIFNERYGQMKLGRFLWQSRDWYNDEPFYKDLGLTFEWKFITKQCIPDSVNKRHDWQEGDEWSKEDSQDYAIEVYANKVGLPSLAFQRPEPWEVLYAIAVHLVSTERMGVGRGERMLDGMRHWSGRVALSGRVVHVGDSNPDGASVSRYTRGHWDDYLGVCLSR